MMSDKTKLAIYDELRKMHSHLRQICAKHTHVLAEDGPANNALDAIDSVLYLAEEHFARMSA